jgi:hypothetical protein
MPRVTRIRENAARMRHHVEHPMLYFETTLNVVKRLVNMRRVAWMCHTWAWAHGRARNTWPETHGRAPGLMDMRADTWTCRRHMDVCRDSWTCAEHMDIQFLVCFHITLCHGRFTVTWPFLCYMSVSLWHGRFTSSGAVSRLSLQLIKWPCRGNVPMSRSGGRVPGE